MEVAQRHLDAALSAANPALSEGDLARWGAFGTARAMGMRS